MSCRHNHTEDSCLSLMHTDNRTCIKTIKCMCVETKPHQPITAKNMMWHTRLWKKKLWLRMNYPVWLLTYENKFKMCDSLSISLFLFISRSFPLVSPKTDWIMWVESKSFVAKQRKKKNMSRMNERVSKWVNGKGKEIVMSITYHQNKHNIYRPIYKNLLILMILPLYSDVYSTSYISLQCSQYTTHNNISKRQHTHESQARVNEWEKI